MDNAVYTALTRQSGLMAEMQAVANNIANASTTGYRREGVVFAEFVAALAPDDPSLSMATAQVRDTRLDQAPVTFTGGSFDLAIEGDGFFMVDEDKLKALPDATLLELQRNGLMNLIQAHWVSLGQMRKLLMWRGERPA